MSKSSGKSKKSNIPVAELNKKYQDSGLKQRVRDAAKSQNTYSESDGPFIYNEPFFCCQLPTFLENETFLNDLKDELLNLKFYEKNNDLYKFHQSDDLKETKSPYISALRTFLYTNFREWVQDVTGFNLSMTMDMNCARYDYTDTLLCHDDMLEGRKIAYIFYLVPTWKDGDGGTLDLFNSDEKGEPSTLAKSILPEWNNLVFFAVSPRSFHQVSEVLTEDKTRLSISGWFYGDPIEVNSSIVKLPPTLSSPIFVEEEFVYDWINPSYLDPITQLEIRQKFEMDSEVELIGFLNEGKYKAVAAALEEVANEWHLQGPVNKRHFEVGKIETFPPIVRECLDLLHSEAIFLTLSHLTGLTLHRLAVEEDNGKDNEEDSSDSNEPETKRTKPDGGGASKVTNKNGKGKDVDAKCYCDVRRWKHGSYTLLHDNEDDLSEFVLDTVLFFNCKDWQNHYGGYMTFIAKDEDEELLTVHPRENALALVFRDKETTRFVKHINHRSTSLGAASHFQTITSVYYE